MNRCDMLHNTKLHTVQLLNIVKGYNNYICVSTTEFELVSLGELLNQEVQRTVSTEL